MGNGLDEAAKQQLRKNLAANRKAIDSSNYRSFSRGADDAARNGGYSRYQAIRDALSDGKGRLLSRAELDGVKFTIRGVERQGFRLDGAIKYRGNQGIDLAFSNGPGGRFALAEAKSSRGLGSLSVDSLGIRQGSFDFFSTRLQRAGRTDLLNQLNAGNVDLFGGFSGSGRLFQFDPNVFVRNINFRTSPAAATLLP